MSLFLPPRVLQALACPSCRGKLSVHNGSLRCEGSGCGQVFPVIDGVPVLVDESTALFSVDDYRAGRARVADIGRSRLSLLAGRFMPGISANFKAEANIEWMQRELLRVTEHPLVLIVGGGTLGDGIEELLGNPAVTCIETDVSFGPRTRVVCDAHRLPFADGALDGVVAQAVLEHVFEPQRCVDEFHRVLGAHGVVYCELPFIQQVHLGRYDFMRFTHVGLRYLFRGFEELGSGVLCGPGTALAWSYQYFLLSFVRSVLAQRVVRVFARVTAFWLKYLDRFVGDSPGALDAASAYFFLGRRAARSLSWQDVVARYQGLQFGGVELPRIPGREP